MTKNDNATVGYVNAVVGQAVKKLKEERPVQPKKKPETSKIIIFTIMLSYYIVLVFGIFAVYRILGDAPEFAIQALIAIFGYVGTPTGVAIGFYAWKARAENVAKIVNGTEQPENEGTADST